MPAGNMKEMLMRLRFGAALAVGLGLCSAISAAASAHTLSEVIAAKTINVGINPNLPPLGEFGATNQMQGFDVDVANKLAALLGVKVNLVPVNSSDRVPFLLAGKIDMVMGGLTRTADRAQVVAFTVPLQTEALSILTTEGKPFTKFSDLNADGVRLIEVRGTTPIDYIKANLPKAQVTLFDNYPDAVRALAQGRGDAIIDVVDYLGQYMKNYNQKWRVIADKTTEVDYDCIGVTQGNDALRSWLNVALYQIESSGFVSDTYKKWFGIPMTYPVSLSPYF
jgi:polar amino acid transport system substrate-binding protein